MQLAFYIAYIVTGTLAAGFVVRYHMLTKGAWRQHPAGVSYMGMAGALVVALGGVVIRVVLFRMAGWTWADTPTKLVVLGGLFLIAAFIAHRWYLLERYQKSDKE
jgi:hypothetical protein